MNTTEAISLIMKGAHTRRKTIPQGDVLNRLLRFDKESLLPDKGINHPLFKKFGKEGRRHLDEGKVVLLLGSKGGGKTVQSCAMGLLTAKTEKTPMRNKIGQGPWEYGGKRTDEDGEYDFWWLLRKKPPQFAYWSATGYLDYMNTKKRSQPDPAVYPHMLILDDLGHEHLVKGKYNYKRLNNLIMERYTGGHATIIISNKFKHEIRNDYAEHIVDRLFHAEHTRLIEHYPEKSMRSE